MGLTIYTWEDHQWVAHFGDTSITVKQPTYGNDTFVINVELVSGSIQIKVYFMDKDIPGDKRFKFCTLNAVNEIEPLIINITNPDSLAIPVPNEHNYDVICFEIVATAINEDTVLNAWIKPASRILRGIRD